MEAECNFLCPPRLHTVTYAQGITDGGAMLCSESILSTYCHADPYKVYRNEVLFALGKPDILDLLRPCNTERSRSNQSA